MIAQKMAPLFHAGDVIVLDGDLGAGKTCFVKGFTEGFHSEDVVNSPTFSIANFYRAAQQLDILHIDLYRIETVDEFNDLGLFDYFDSSVVLIEWGNKFAGLFESCLLVSFQINDDNIRALKFECYGDKHTAKMNEIKKILKGDSLC